jgi:hypothetical protein
VLKEKRALPGRLLEADQKVEEWRKGVLKGLMPEAHLAAYQLTQTVTLRAAALAAQYMSTDPSRYEMAARTQLLGLQFALAGLPTDRPVEPIQQGQVEQALTSKDIATAAKVVNLMYDYSLARDAFVSYMWGAYELAPSVEGETAIHFIDPPEWPGHRDRAQRHITQEVKAEFARTFKPTSIDPIEVTLEKTVSLPSDLPMGGLSAKQFVAGWNVLVNRFGEVWLDAKTPVLERTELLELTMQQAGLTAPEAERFLSLITFSADDSAVTLFHCPVISLTHSSLAIVPSALLLGNPSAIVPRLSIRRGLGIDGFSNVVEAHLLGSLQKQFESPLVDVRTRIEYNHAGEPGDIDFVAYEKPTNRLVVGQVKAFIQPDSVEEVHRANESLAEALDQLERARRWLASIPSNRLLHTLGIESENVPEQIELTAIGNGFTGSDFLAIPADVTIVGADWLLLPRFRHSLPGAAVRLFRERFQQIMDGSPLDGMRARLALGDVQIEVPNNG